MSEFTGHSRRSTRCLTVLGAALAAFGLAASASATPRPPASVPPAAHALAAAPAAVTCKTPGVSLYHVDALGQLRRWSYASPLDGSSGWTQQLIGVGWNGLNVMSGGNGVLFTIDSSGDLHWYLDNMPNGSGGASWDPASGSVIGTGWGGFTSVVSDGQGVLYAVDAVGDLHWYRYVGTNGSFAWAPGSGAVIGSGWNAMSKLIAGGSGVIFAVDRSGALLWYRDLDEAGGTAAWADSGLGTEIGSGWSGFTQIGSMGGGVIVARDATGQALWYRNADPLGGSASWANGGIGIGEGTGWRDSQFITDVLGCTAS